MLEEIEKEKKDVLNVMLKVMEEGRMKEGKGKKVDLRNKVIIMK